jgi:hypothetical protein
MIEQTSVSILCEGVEEINADPKREGLVVGLLNANLPDLFSEIGKEIIIDWLESQGHEVT